MEKEYVVYQNKWKQTGLSLLGILMTLSSLLVFLAGVADTQWLFIIIGLIGSLFFGWCEVYIIKELFRGKKLVILTNEGFYDYSSALATKGKLVPWNQVRIIENQSIVGQSFVSVSLKDPESFLSELSALQRKLIAANVKMGFGEINITLQSAKKCTNDQLIEKMNQFMREQYSESPELGSI